MFADSPICGNPVAVVHGADGLPDELLARIARWTNLSETTFLLEPTDPQADYRLRIFTPQKELPFAGHPTLGSAHAWLEAGGRPRDPGLLVQQCGGTRIHVRRDAHLAFAAPPLHRSGPVDETTLTRAVHALGTTREMVVAHRWADNGPGWLVIEVPSVEILRSLRPHAERLEGLAIGVFALTEPGADHLYEVRAIFPGVTDCEDPVTGSLHAGIAQWLRGDNRVPASYRARQGAATGRDGLVCVDDDGESIWIGGHTETVVSGRLRMR